MNPVFTNNQTVGDKISPQEVVMFINVDMLCEDIVITWGYSGVRRVTYHDGYKDATQRIETLLEGYPEAADRIFLHDRDEHINIRNMTLPDFKLYIKRGKTPLTRVEYIGLPLALREGEIYA